MEHTIAQKPEARSLFKQVSGSDLFTADETPKPTGAERQPPVTEPDAGMAQSTPELE